MKLRRILAVSVLAAATIIAVLHGWGFHSTPQIVHAQQYAPCAATGATPLSCQSAGRGNVSIAAAASSTVVNDASVGANSSIVVSFDASLGTLLGVTCNTTAQQPYVTARVPGVSFTISTAATFTTNPGCITFEIVN